MTRFFLTRFCQSSAACCVFGLSSLLTAGLRADDLDVPTPTRQSVAEAADDLFSNTSISEIFKQEEKDSKSEPRANEKTQKVVRVLNVAQLGEVLKDANLEPEVGDSAITLKLKQGNRTFNTVLGLDENRQQIVIVLRLLDLEGKPALTTEKLMSILIVNRDLRPAMFSYNDKAKRIELLMGVDNDSISPLSLRNELKRLATVAESASPLWDLDAAPPSGQTAQAPQQGAPQAAPQAAPQSNPPAQTGIANNQRPAAPAQPNNAIAQAPQQQQRPATPAPAQTASVIGRWSAARSATEAFAMQLNTDGSFTLVYVKDGKQSKSTGKYTLAGSQLTLNTNDGGKFNGSISNVTARSFEFIPPTNAAGKLTFQKAS